ncbi:Flavodoxin reductases (ferredoxin-NADPH reductases) family 1, partial [uncultured Microcoleus sp.]
VLLFPICQLLKLFLNIANKAKHWVRVKLSDCFVSGLKTKYKI